MQRQVGGILSITCASCVTHAACRCGIAEGLQARGVPPCILARPQKRRVFPQYFQHQPQRMTCTVSEAQARQCCASTDFARKLAGVYSDVPALIRAARVIWWREVLNLNLDRCSIRCQRLLKTDTVVLFAKIFSLSMTPSSLYQMPCSPVT